MATTQAYIKVWWRKKYTENPKLFREKANAYHHKNKERIAKRIKENRGKVKLETIGIYSANRNECNCCKEKEIGFLTIDHIQNNGAEERKRLKINGGFEFYQYLKRKNYPKGYQVLCYNCNHAKYLYGKCSHKT